MISQKAKYAFKALVFLARRGAGNAVRIEAIAREAKVPRRFLEHILLDLKAGGIVVSRRGRNGGYALSKQPAEVTIGHILRIIDGPIAPLSCISRTAYRRCRDCPDEADCAVRRIFARAYEATLAAMDGTTIADGEETSDVDPDSALGSIVGPQPISVS